MAVVAGDSVQSLDRFHPLFHTSVSFSKPKSRLIRILFRSAEFLKRADASCSSPDQKLASPVIPNGAVPCLFQFVILYLCIVFLHIGRIRPRRTLAHAEVVALH